MTLGEPELAELHAAALTVAARAAAYIRTVAKPHEVLRKSGGSSEASQVVTEVDLESQRMILDGLADSIQKYSLGLLAEECADDRSRLQREYFWCIDPLDGTLPFIEGVPGYSVSVALVRSDGVPVVGVIHDPLADTVYHAVRGRGAQKNGRNWQTDCPSSRELTLVMDRSFPQHRDYEVRLERIRDIARDAGLEAVNTICQGGAAMNACWVIENAPALYLKFPKAKAGGGSLWDFAASACLFGELGGAVASDISGNPLPLNRAGSTFLNECGVVYASDARLAEAVYERFGGK